MCHHTVLHRSLSTDKYVPGTIANYSEHIHYFQLPIIVLFRLYLWTEFLSSLFLRSFKRKFGIKVFLAKFVSSFPHIPVVAYVTWL